MATRPPFSDDVLPRRRVSRARYWMRRLWVGTALVLVLALIGTGGLYGYARYRYGQIHKVDIRHRPILTSATGTMNILLAGDNCRACLNGRQAAAFGTGSEVGGGRSDVTMVLHLDLRSGKASLLSIPRDLFLPVPGTTTANRIDAALNHGPEALVEQIEDDLGIPIDHYVSVNFDTFQSIVDDLGGIDMYFPTPVKDAYSGLKVTATGCQHLDGFQALAVVRARHLYYFQNGSWHYDGFGDLSRIKRDHVFLQVMAAYVQHHLTNPLAVNQIVGTVAPQLEVDSGLALGTMVSLARQFRSLNAAGVPTYTLPVVVDPGTYYYRGANYGDVVFPDYPDDSTTIAQFLGQPAPAPAAPGLAVSVLNGTGARNQAATTASSLSGLGYDIAATGDTAPVGSPAETTVYYSAGHRDDALALASHLTGLVAVGPLPSAVGPPSSPAAVASVATASASGPAVSASGPTDPVTAAASGAALVVVTGTSFAVSPPPIPTNPTGTATPAPANPASAPAQTTTTTSPVPSGLGAPTPAQASLPDFDPTACPPGQGS
ncbi:MAG TPA: LCP family protein [Acidimicrobiales bacterium]|nr:LCP family protein [Acidimicrobiales bacterium]